MRKQLIGAGFVTAVASVAACGMIKQLQENGGSPDRNTSVFASYASEYCTLTNADESKQLKTDCGNAYKMVAPDSKYCTTDKPFRIEKVYFPNRALPMKACRELFPDDNTGRSLVRFAVLGDSGAGESIEKGFRQVSVAKALHAVCPPRQQQQLDEQNPLQRSCDFAIHVGDIIYARGLTDPWDSLLESRFEEPYRAFAPMPFFMVPGNHDYAGNRHTFVEASYFSDIWRIPHPFYALEKLPPWLRMVGIDTSALTGEDEAPLTADEQVQLMTDQLCDKNNWNIVFGHYPAFSNGRHGNHYATRAILAKTYAQCPFDLYLAGHDHDQELIKTPQFVQMVQGAGGAEIKEVHDRMGQYTEETQDGQLKLEQLIAASVHGFSVVEATATQLTFYFYDIVRTGTDIPADKNAANAGFSSWYARCQLSKSAGISCEKK